MRTAVSAISWSIITAQESVDYLAEPLLAGVYGGDPGQLSANSVLTRFVEMETKYGSLTRAVLTERRKAGKRPSGSAPLFQHAQIRAGHAH